MKCPLPFSPSLSKQIMRDFDQVLCELHLHTPFLPQYLQICVKISYDVKKVE